jgi:predicted GIY-YIG superfamily endonuclease
MPIGYDDSDVRIKHILINPTIKISGIKSRLEEFSDKKLLFYKIVHDRNQMTHELYFPAMGVNRVLQPLHKAFKDEKDFKTWCKKWKEQVTKRARDADLCTARLSSIDNEIATKIVEYKESLIRVK